MNNNFSQNVNIPAARWGIPSFSNTNAAYTMPMPHNGVTANFHPAMGGGMKPTNGNQNKASAFFSMFKM